MVFEMEQKMAFGRIRFVRLVGVLDYIDFERDWSSSLVEEAVTVELRFCTCQQLQRKLLDELTSRNASSRRYMPDEVDQKHLSLSATSSHRCRALPYLRRPRKTCPDSTDYPPSRVHQVSV
jgi:hypothetical protein